MCFGWSRILLFRANEIGYEFTKVYRVLVVPWFCLKIQSIIFYPRDRRYNCVAGELVELENKPIKPNTMPHSTKPRHATQFCFGGPGSLWAYTRSGSVLLRS